MGSDSDKTRTEECIDAAAETLEGGQLVVYPTETVYGLGADALDPDAVERVFSAKNRDRSRPISMAVPDVEAIREYTEPTDREMAFVREFLPGPVTVVLERKSMVPDVLTAGRDRVGIRIPDHDIALALLERFAPITATSVNVSGNPSARRPDEIDEEIRRRVRIILDGGESPGGGSTVVDVTSGEIHREGLLADEVTAWLDGH